MQLTPREKDKLLVSMAAAVARRRLERGVKLNHPEAVALITDHVVEGARQVADLVAAAVLGHRLVVVAAAQALAGAHQAAQRLGHAAGRPQAAGAEQRQAQQRDDRQREHDFAPAGKAEREFERFRGSECAEATGSHDPAGQ